MSDAQQTWDKLPLEQAAGQLLIGGFDAATPTPPSLIQEALAQSVLGGVILFRRNVKDIEQVVALNEALHAAGAKAPLAPLICVDQEGGRVVRLREPLTRVGPMRDLGQTRDARYASQVSEVIATELEAVGFNVNFAPVLDVDTNPDNPVIGDRALSHSPQWVARLGGAFIGGHIVAGVTPCAKHFPGHGDTLQDSHLTLPTILHDIARLERMELVPFEAAIRAGVPMIMTAHIVVSSIDPIYPATLSPQIIDSILRKKMGFEGIVVSDCLEMKAVSEHYTIEELVERGLMAGVDLFLICHTEDKWRRAHAHLIKRAQEDPIIHARLYQSVQRIARHKTAFMGNLARPWRARQGWREVLGCQEHEDIVARMNAPKPVDDADPTEA